MNKVSKIFFGIFITILLSPLIFFASCFFGSVIVPGGEFGNARAGFIIGTIAVLIFLFFMIRAIIRESKEIQISDKKEQQAVLQ
jgi:hypothetical protein